MGREHNREAIADWRLWDKKKPEDSAPEEKAEECNTDHKNEED